MFFERSGCARLLCISSSSARVAVACLDSWKHPIALVLLPIMIGATSQHSAMAGSSPHSKATRSPA